MILDVISAQDAASVSLAMTEKVDVNGAARHPLYQPLVTASDAHGETGATCLFGQISQ